MGEAITAGNNFELIKKVYVKNLILHGHTVSSESRGTSHLAGGEQNRAKIRVAV